jgi:general secretion pathway protein F
MNIAVFIEQLRDLLVAGLSVIEALEALQRDSDSRASEEVSALISRLRGGQPLSAALGTSANMPQVLVALVRTAELTSDLPQALTRYLDHERRSRELKHRIVSLAIYPTLVMSVGAGVLLFLALYVMPRFSVIFAGMSGDLPWSARAIVVWSSWLSQHQAAMLVILVLGATALTAAVAMPAIRARMLRHMLDLSPLRTRLRTYFLSRWYRTTGMLLQGGIPLPEALHLSLAVLPPGLRTGGATVERAVRDGLSPSEAHRRGAMTTAVAEQLLRAGERTGDLGRVLTRVADFHDAEVTRQLERGMRALEPLVMTFIGLCVGTVVVLMYLPIFELASAIQ